MEQKSLLGNKTLLLGGATVLTGLSYLAYKRFYNKEESGEVASIEQTIKILKQFKRDFYPIFSNLIILSLRFQGQYRSRYQSVPESFLEKIEGALTSENPIFLEQINVLEDKIYSENNITNRKMFEIYCLKLSNQNAAVQAILNDIRTAYRNALRGKPERPNFNLPEKLTPELIFKIYKNRVVNALTKILDAVDNYKKIHGAINVQDPEFNKQIGKITQGNDQNNIFEGYDIEFDEFIHPKMMFNSAVSTFDKSNIKFKQNIQLLEVKENNLMQKIVLSKDTYEKILKDIESIKNIGEPVVPLIREIEPEKAVEEPVVVEKQFVGDSTTKGIEESQFEKIENVEENKEEEENVVVEDNKEEEVDEVVEDNKEEENVVVEETNEVEEAEVVEETTEVEDNKVDEVVEDNKVDEVVEDNKVNEVVEENTDEVVEENTEEVVEAEVVVEAGEEDNVVETNEVENLEEN